MNREQYLSKRSQSHSQMPDVQRAEQNGDDDADISSTVESVENQTEDDGDKAKLDAGGG